ncbi:hypothetical protein [Paenarthrobacter ilicis]|uniref:hypothetical protein n=1 Tax=Paenarthrobacter ilicis TaxID=43665 RepID=UPI002D7AA055|nr:hypothetical protein [Paenarthrobacter ilicis]
MGLWAQQIEAFIRNGKSLNWAGKAEMIKRVFSGLNQQKLIIVQWRVLPAVDPTRSWFRFLGKLRTRGMLRRSTDAADYQAANHIPWWP